MTYMIQSTNLVSQYMSYEYVLYYTFMDFFGMHESCCGSEKFGGVRMTLAISAS